MDRRPSGSRLDSQLPVTGHNEVEFVFLVFCSAAYEVHCSPLPCSQIHGNYESATPAIVQKRFLFGLGEWKNNKVTSWFKPPNFYTGGAALISAIIRNADFLGVLLELAGLASIATGIWRLLRP